MKMRIEQKENEHTARKEGKQIERELYLINIRPSPRVLLMTGWHWGGEVSLGCLGGGEGEAGAWAVHGQARGVFQEAENFVRSSELDYGFKGQWPGPRFSLENLHTKSHRCVAASEID